MSKKDNYTLADVFVLLGFIQVSVIHSIVFDPSHELYLLGVIFALVIGICYEAFKSPRWDKYFVSAVVVGIFLFDLIDYFNW